MTENDFESGARRTRGNKTRCSYRSNPAPLSYIPFFLSTPRSFIYFPSISTSAYIRARPAVRGFVYDGPSSEPAQRRM